MHNVETFLARHFGDLLPPDLPPYPRQQDPGAYAAHAKGIEDLLNAHSQASLIPLMQRLTWATPTVGASDPTFVSNTMFVQFYGPDGEVKVPDQRLGLFYMGPNFSYAPHHHEAHETYVRVAGECTFTLGAAQDRTETGPQVLNPPNQVHAMKAGPQGVLLAWLWTGDIRWETYAYDES